MVKEVLSYFKFLINIKHFKPTDKNEFGFRAIYILPLQ